MNILGWIKEKLHIEVSGLGTQWTDAQLKVWLLANSNGALPRSLLFTAFETGERGLYASEIQEPHRLLETAGLLERDPTINSSPWHFRITERGERIALDLKQIC